MSISWSFIDDTRERKRYSLYPEVLQMAILFQQRTDYNIDSERELFYDDIVHVEASAYVSE